VDGVVGFVDLVELLPGGGVVLGVVLQGKPAVGVVDLLLGGAAVDAQDLVGTTVAVREVLIKEFVLLGVLYAVLAVEPLEGVVGVGVGVGPMRKFIVVGADVVVGEDIIGLIDVVELGFGLFSIGGMRTRVPLLRQFLVGLIDCLLVCALLEAEDGVVVFLARGGGRCHWIWIFVISVSLGFKILGGDSRIVYNCFFGGLWGDGGGCWRSAGDALVDIWGSYGLQLGMRVYAVMVCDRKVAEEVGDIGPCAAIAKQCVTLRGDWSENR
jgi:hypothetical protein